MKKTCCKSYSPGSKRNMLLKDKGLAALTCVFLLKKILLLSGNIAAAEIGMGDHQKWIETRWLSHLTDKAAKALCP